MNDESKDWYRFSMGERIVRAAWMATRQHLNDVEDSTRRVSPTALDQADELRRMVALARHRGDNLTSDGEAE